MQATIERKAPAAMDEAQKFLKNILAKGPVEAAEIYDASEGNGIAKRTVDRAKAKLGVIARKEKGHTDGKWTWELPPGVAAAPRSYVD
jgi:hypothetical protein